MEFEDLGMVIGKGYGTLNITKRNICPHQAYQLGKSI